MESFHDQPEPRQYQIEGIEGGLIEYEDDWEGVKTFSLIEKIIQMSMECSGADHQSFPAARFIYRSVMEIIIIFLFISYFVIISLL